MDFNSRPNSADSLSQQMSSLNSNHFYHHSSPQQNASLTSGGQAMANQPMPTAPQMGLEAQNASQNGVYSGFAQNSEYMSQYSLYVQQYYREYYRQWLQHNRSQHLSSLSSHSSSAAPTLRQPLKYGSHRSHARAVFSQHNNNLLVLDNTSVGLRSVRLYSLCDLFVDYLFPQQMFHLLLRDNQLPFASRDSALQWIRCKQQVTTGTTGTTTDVNFELKLILRIIQMILKQNSRITGLDLSELLFDLIDSSVLNKTFIYSENEFQNNSLNTFRALLMRGQKTVALNSALSTGLMDHALTLSYLMESLSEGDDDGDRRGRRETTATTEDLMIKTIRKFCDTLRANDPISVFYNSVLNRIQRKTNCFLELSFESFLVLLANELDLSSICVKSQQFHHLLAFVKSLMSPQESTNTDFILSDDLFESQMDSLLVNECLEFSRFSGKTFNSRLIEKKVKFVSILFDFGFVSNSLKYCQQMKAFCDLSSTTRRLCSQIESRFYPNITSFETTLDDNPSEEPSLWSPKADTQPLSDVTNETTQVDSETTPVKRIEIIPPISEVTTTTTTTSAAQDFPPSVHSVPHFAPVPTFIPPVVPMNEPMSASFTQPELESLPNGDIPFSFVSSSQSLPSMPFNSNFENEFQNKETTVDDNNSSMTTQTTADDRTASETDNKSKATNSGFLSKLLPFNFKSKNQAILPDDSKMTLIFDKNSNQWIDTSLQHNGGQTLGQTTQSSNTAMRAPPPMAPPPIGSMGVPPTATAPKNFGFRSQKRYVDITRKQ